MKFYSNNQKIIRALTFIILIILLDKGIGYSLKELYFKQSNGIYYLTTYSMDSTNAELVVFGSSRANHHYNPDIFEEKLKIESFNTGRDGQSIIFYLAIQRSILQRYVPKIFILDLTPSDLEYTKNDYDRISSISPYYSEKDYLHDLIYLKNDFERIKFISSIYPYNSLIFSIIDGNLKSVNIKNNYKGYRPLFNELTSVNEPTYYPNNRDLDSIKINLLEDFIKNSIHNKIKLNIVISPYLTKIQNNKAIQQIDSLTRIYNISFYDFSNNYFFQNNPHYFADEGHLNDRGAEVFTNLLAIKLEDNFH